MATWDDVRRIALSLPDTREDQRRGLTFWLVHDKLFVWERPRGDLISRRSATPRPTDRSSVLVSSTWWRKKR